MLEIDILEKILEKYKKNNNEVWSSITTNQGSVDTFRFFIYRSRKRCI